MKLLSDELSRRVLPQLDEDLFGTSRRRKSYGVQEVETSFQSRLKTYSIPNGHALTPHDFLADVTPVVRGLIIKHLKRLRGLKVNLLLLAIIRRAQRCRSLTLRRRTPRSWKEPSSRRAIERLVREMDEFEARGSGWTLAREILEVRINKHSPLRGSSYVELPKWIRDKKSVVNM